MEQKPMLFAISGVKNSGKTTLITKLIPILTEKGLKVATIKHDGHEFAPDVPGTDTWAHLQAGALGTAIFSDTKFMVVKQEAGEYGVIFRWLQIDMNKRGRWEEWNPVCDRLKTGVVWYLAWMYR